MIYDSQLRDAAIEKHEDLQKQAAATREVHRAGISHSKPLRVKIGRLLIRAGERLAGNPDNRELERAFR